MTTSVDFCSCCCFGDKSPVTSIIIPDDAQTTIVDEANYDVISENDDDHVLCLSFITTSSEVSLLAVSTRSGKVNKTPQLFFSCLSVYCLLWL
jgi:hypothetical protein